MLAISSIFMKNIKDGDYPSFIALLYHQGETTKIVISIVIPIPVIAVEGAVRVPPQVEAIAGGRDENLPSAARITAR